MNNPFILKEFQQAQSKLSEKLDILSEKELNSSLAKKEFDTNPCRNEVQQVQSKLSEKFDILPEKELNSSLAKKEFDTNPCHIPDYKDGSILESKDISVYNAREPRNKESHVENLGNKRNEQFETTKIHTRNEGLEGSTHPETGVRYERKIIELDNGETVEGVFPVFESCFDCQLPKDLYKESDAKQFEECGKQLKQKCIEDPKFRKQFSERALDDIMNDRTPPYGYTWHHSETQGKMQLVEYDTHAKSGHTGGRTIWGGGNENR